MRRLRIVVGLCVLLADQAAAQTSVGLDDNGWESLRVPGGVSALLTTAGIDSTLPRTRSLRDIIRFLYTAPPGADRELDVPRERVLAYLEALSAFEQAASALGPVVPPLAQAEIKETRRRWEDLAEAIGHKLERRSRAYLLIAEEGERHVRRRRDLGAAGLDIAGLAARLNRGEAAVLALPSDTVPLPLPLSAWPAMLNVPRRLAGSLLSAILGDRSAALLYYGLTAVDQDTRAYFGRRPALLAKIVGSDRAAVFAGFGRSLKVRDGRVIVPGDSAAEPMWEALTRESVRDPDRFIAELLDKDAGRLALLYDAAMLIDGPRQRFLLGMGIDDASVRRERFEQLYRAMAAALPGWDPRVRPFFRSRYDIAHLLWMTPVGSNGEVAALRWAGLWRRVFAGDDLPGNAADQLKDLEREGTVDAAGMTELLTQTGQTAHRAETWAFGHRVFTGASRAQLPDVLVTLRGFRRFRILALTLDRVGVTDPRVYAAAVLRAEQLTRVEDRQRAGDALALFQGALGLIERARLGRVISQADATSLVRSLSALEPAEGGRYRGGVGVWLSSAYLPVVLSRLAPTAGVSQTPTAEDAILRAFAGRALGLADSPHLNLTIEGLPYEVDVSGAALGRLRDVRARQQAVSVDAVLNVIGVAKALAESRQTLEGLPVLASGLERTAHQLLKDPGLSQATWFDRGDFSKRVGRAATDVRKIKKVKDLNKLSRIPDDTLEACDALLARALLSLVYAPHLSDPDAATLLAGDPSDRHDWGLSAAPLAPPAPNPWLMAREGRTQSGWRLQGAILAIDVALSAQALRRVVSDRVPLAPDIKDNDRDAATEAVVLANPFDCVDADRDVLVTAIRQGRARIASVKTDPASWPQVAAEAGVTDFRRHMLAWTLKHEPERFTQFLSMAELMRLGQNPDAPFDRLDAWGTSGRSFDGRMSLAFPTTQPFDLLAGRRGSGLVGALVPDLALVVAEALVDRGLPAVLGREVLAAASQDFVDEFRPIFEDDWLTMLAFIPTLAQRTDDYVAALTVGGALRPARRRE